MKVFVSVLFVVVSLSYASTTTTTNNDSKLDTLTALEHAREEVRTRMFDFVLAANTEALLGAGSAGRLQTAASLIEGLQGAESLTNLTQMMYEIFVVIHPRFLNEDLSEKDQRQWLRDIIVLEHISSKMPAGRYMSLLVSGMQTLLKDSLVREFFSDPESRSALINELEDLQVRVSATTSSATAHSGVVTAMGLHRMAPLALAISSSGTGLLGTTSLSVAGIGAKSGLASLFGISNMAAGPVALTLAPILGSCGSLHYVLPDDSAGVSGKAAATGATLVAPAGVYALVTANGAGYMQMMSTLASWGGGTLASGGGGAAAGIATLGALSGAGVLALGMGTYAAVRLGQWAAYRHAADEDPMTSVPEEAIEQAVSHLLEQREAMKLETEFWDEEERRAQQMTVIFGCVLLVSCCIVTAAVVLYTRSRRFKTRTEVSDTQVVKQSQPSTLTYEQKLQLARQTLKSIGS